MDDILREGIYGSRIAYPESHLPLEHFLFKGIITTLPYLETPLEDMTEGTIRPHEGQYLGHTAKNYAAGFIATYTTA